MNSDAVRPGGEEGGVSSFSSLPPGHSRRHAGNSTVTLYDKVGNRTKLTDAEGNSTTFYYDELNRMTKLVYADGQSITYAYNENGAVKSKTDGNSKTIHYIYDPLNRLAEIHEE